MDKCERSSNAEIVENPESFAAHRIGNGQMICAKIVGLWILKCDIAPCRAGIWTGEAGIGVFPPLSLSGASDIIAVNQMDRRDSMGLTLKFLAGAPKGVLDAISEYDYAKLDRLTEKEADFSLHLQPKDLQTLSDCAASFTSRFLKPFRTALVCYLDEEDRGYFLVNDDWVEAVAAIDRGRSKALAGKWFEKMAEDYPDEGIGKPSAEAEAAVAKLIELCQYAVQQSKPVIHIWMA